MSWFNPKRTAEERKQEMKDIIRNSPKQWCGCEMSCGREYHEYEIEYDGDQPIKKIICHHKYKYLFIKYQEVKYEKALSELQ